MVSLYSYSAGIAIERLRSGERYATINNPMENALIVSRTKNSIAVFEDIHIIHLAKCELIVHHEISEEQAHRLIEKRAMNMRTTRRAVAEKILKHYENAPERPR